ncbi:MAG: patatin-like phospholipase family protein, partial [Candidatus Dormiibacterota bacterium]
MATSRKPSKTALVLASGGVSGVSYEVGALRALDHVLTNRTVNDFDIYVGTSAGAVVSAALACGIPPIMLAGLLTGTVPGFSRLSPLSLYRPNVGEVVERLWGAPQLLRNAASEYWRFRDRLPLSEVLYALTPLLPTGIFTNGGLERYIGETLAMAGLSDDFRDIRKELHIIAADIESNRRADFSQLTTPNVPVSKAVAASTCIPIVFRPVEIDGHHYVDGGVKGHAAIDVAISRGAKLIVVINALVPLDTEAIGKRASVDETRKTIYDLGLRAVVNQILRGMLHDSLIDHLQDVRAKNPDVDFILIEPRPDDEKMFFHEVMSFSAQLIVMQHGYETVTKGLYEVWPYLSRVLPKHGIELTRHVVDKKPLEVPVTDLERTNVLGRLFQTVLDRRISAKGERPDISARVQT